MLNTKIVVLDDTKATREVIKRNLAKSGYQVFTAENFENAKILINEVKPQLCIATCLMYSVHYTLYNRRYSSFLALFSWCCTHAGLLSCVHLVR